LQPAEDHDIDILVSLGEGSRLVMQYKAHSGRDGVPAHAERTRLVEILKAAALSSWKVL
jgi:hypothetical protein